MITNHLLKDRADFGFWYAPIADGFPDARLRRDLRYRAELFEIHRVFALSGLCAAVLPNGAVENERERGLLVPLPGPRLGRELSR